jgi:hypothetical protein
VVILKLKGGAFMGSGKYTSCTIAGDGKLYTQSNNKSEKFKIIDMSAARIILETSAVLQEAIEVKLKIRLTGGPVEAHIDISGKIKSRFEKSYEIEFINLSDSAREEIDELMKNTCNIE